MSETKVCSKCGDAKLFSEFGRDPKGRSGLRSVCRVCDAERARSYQQANKECVRARAKAYYQKNKTDIAERDRAYREANSAKISARKRKYRADNKNTIAERNKAKYLENREAHLQKARAHYFQNKEYYSLRSKAYNKENRPELAEKSKIYREKNKESLASAARERLRDRRSKDRFFVFRKRIGTMIGDSLRRRGYTKRSRSHEILGCDWATFAAHIERQFLPGMSWENRSEWHIDHIVPMATAQTEEDVIRLNHHTNLRPIWAKDNLSKGAQITHLI